MKALQYRVLKNKPINANSKTLETKFQQKETAKVKLIVAKPKAKTGSTSYLIDAIWDGRLWYNLTYLKSLPGDVWVVGKCIVYIQVVL